ncbi:DUF2690 domain-containing protein [Streptomyces sp. NPDC058872]|uniref:DUF2690 domain-containing protein n=1 Tax=Streptomyces sp. NPDC058872 TaxID=3346661 RepID=UPI0036C476EF
MKTYARKLATAGSTLVLAASSLLLASSPASAATSCYAKSCEGLDPSRTVCQNDARTVGTTGAGVELRYSPTCRAAWARKKNGTDNAFETRIQVTNSNGSGYSLPYVSGTLFTRMVNDAGIVSWACETRYYFEGGHYNSWEECTGKY